MTDLDDSLVCCVPIPNIMVLGATYQVIIWINHRFGSDPVVVCEDGKPRLMWRGMFHD